MLNKAVDELEKQLADEDKHVRFRAARRLLALARHFRPPDEPTPRPVTRLRAGSGQGAG